MHALLSQAGAEKGEMMSDQDEGEDEEGGTSQTKMHEQLPPAVVALVVCQKR